LKRFLIFLAIAMLAEEAGGAVLPGFRVEKVADGVGFISSLVVDSRGAIYYTTTKGAIARLDGDHSTVVATVATDAVGNSGLLGMALVDDRTAVVHYTRPAQTYDVISSIDLLTGAETVIHAFEGDIGVPSRGVSPEHHGGNPIIGGAGAIYVGIGDYGAMQIAADPAWNAGKIFRIDRDGKVTQIASGFRNPFDLAWDPEKQRLIVPDNGDLIDDEINIINLPVTHTLFYGWPYTMGNEPPFAGAIPPVYVFPEIVAPTGIVRLSGRNDTLQHGYLLSAFVTRAIYFIRDIDAPLPIPITKGDVGPIVDVTEGPGGEVYFSSGSTIYRLVVPLRGDCNGDGKVTFDDLAALEIELSSGNPLAPHFGCDADGDGLITANDRGALWRLLTNRFPAVRHR
jgi:glucose/arabinose dehydrogenase